MRLSVLSISCRSANIVFSRLDGSLDSRATSLTTFLSSQWILLACLRCCYVSCPHVPQNRPANLLYSIYSLFFETGGFVRGWRRWCRSCKFCWRSWMWGVLWYFWVGMAKSRQYFLNISWEREFYPSFTVIIPLEGNTSEARSAPIHFHHIPLRHYF